MNRAVAFLSLAFVLSAVLMPSAAAAQDFVAAPVAIFEGAADSPLLMPTDVAVHAERIFVADGVNHRVVAFRDGAIESIKHVGDVQLINPVGLDVDSAGRLWIADADTGKVILRGLDGEWVRTFDLPAAARKPQPTDVAAVGDGDTVWVVDNDSHRVLFLRTETAAWEAILPAHPGAELFQYPFLATARGDRLYVTDVANGRIRAIAGTGAVGPIIGRYGLGPGSLYRPKGIAVDTEGRVWVTDSVLGTIHIFAADGSAAAVLKDPGGAALQLNTPIGLSLVDRRLFVVESGANRVSQFEITSGTLQPPPDKGPPAVAPQQPQQCTVCHIDWLPGFRESPRVQWAAAVGQERAPPVASRPEMCYSCHDASIADSRRRVWLEHGHRVGVELPPGMTAPNHLPLVDGALACRTCHSAHTHGGTTMETAIFLRVQKSPDELCISCHSDYQGSPINSHPSGPSLLPLPKTLPRARPRQDVPEVVHGCTVCHAGHGAEQNNLLAAPPDTLCISCHAELSPQKFAGANRSQFHPVLAGDTDVELDCLSCHDMHRAVEPEHLLTAVRSEGTLCRTCHSGFDTVLGTPHDLTANRIGAEDEGPDALHGGSACGVCHAVHQPALARVPTEGNPSGDCATCHRPDGIAPNSAGYHLAHPLLPAGAGAISDPIECGTCHNPHDPANGLFLRAAPDQLCAECHRTEVESLGEAHSFGGTNLQNAFGRSASEAGNCGFCHSMHQGVQPALWALAREPVRPETHCTTCHSAGGLAATMIPKPLLHPVDLRGAAGIEPGLDLLQRPHGSGANQLTCADCHNPHASSEHNPAMLRIVGSSGEPELCYTCHAETRNIEQSMHAAQFVNPGGMGAACGPCHSVHGDLDQPGPTMWNGPLGAASTMAHTDLCTGCHSAAAGHHDVDFRPHPLSPVRPFFLDEPGDPATNERVSASVMPLAGAECTGCSGQITCVTCHLPHGRSDAAGIPVLLDHTPLPVFRAAKPMLRPYTPPNLCSSCHGFEGLRLFLEYHDRSAAPVAD